MKITLNPIKALSARIKTCELRKIQADRTQDVTVAERNGELVIRYKGEPVAPLSAFKGDMNDALRACRDLRRSCREEEVNEQ